MTLIFDDAARYLREEGKTQGYDVIVCDSSDPVGPADVLFQPEFFKSMGDALAPGGILCTQVFYRLTYMQNKLEQICINSHLENMLVF